MCPFFLTLCRACSPGLCSRSADRFAASWTNEKLIDRHFKSFYRDATWRFFIWSFLSLTTYGIRCSHRIKLFHATFYYGSNRLDWAVVPRLDGSRNVENWYEWESKDTLCSWVGWASRYLAVYGPWQAPRRPSEVRGSGFKASSYSTLGSKNVGINFLELCEVDHEVEFLYDEPLDPRDGPLKPIYNELDTRQEFGPQPWPSQVPKKLSNLSKAASYVTKHQNVPWRKA